MKSSGVGDVIDLPAKQKEAKATGGSRPATGFGARARALSQAMGTALGALASSPRGWMAVTCVMLGISGGIRYWRGLQFYDLTKESRQSPFPLAEVPKVIGAWRMDEGMDNQLDPEIARIAGSSDHFVRQYTNGKTGDIATVLVIYGLASTVAFHTPEVCYPAAGWTAAGAEPMTDHELKIPGVDKVATYRRGFFSKTLAGHSEYADVVYSFRHTGDWLPNMTSRWKTFRYNPGMFKIQVARVVTDLNIEDNTCPELLGDLMREVEIRLAQKASASAPGGSRSSVPGKIAK
jgi:Protein of unknown function (DUF3485)